MFSALVLLGAPPLTAQTDFCEQDGLIVMEVESAPPSGDWVEETVNPGSSGSYYRWAGPNHYNNPGQGILTYTFTVTTPGKYHLRIRNYHDNPDITLDNDAWTRVDCGSWLKVYSSLAGKWLWQTDVDPPTGSDFAAFCDLTAGAHAFEISGRSHDFRIDRIHLFLDSVSDPLDPNHPETLCTWVDLGGGLAGSSGELLLEGSGTLLPADPITLTLAGALPNARTALIIGFAQINAPFKGGVLVPRLDFLISGLSTGLAGQISLSSAWPSGIPADTTMYFQYCIHDPAGPFDFAASNAISGTTPEGTIRHMPRMLVSCPYRTPRPMPSGSAPTHAERGLLCGGGGRVRAR